MSQVKYDEYGNKLINDAGNITFVCPSCGDAEISRSKQARALGKEYKCPKCNFVGP